MRPVPVRLAVVAVLPSHSRLIAAAIEAEKILMSAETAGVDPAVLMERGTKRFRETAFDSSLPAALRAELSAMLFEGNGA